MATSKNFIDLLNESLKDPQEAAAYLNAALIEYEDDNKESQQLLLEVLEDIAKAQGWT